jgi:glycosyltransferase involved in cell wall biosynthesis
MDNALEQMKIMSSICELHVLIELSPDSLKSTVVDFTKLNTKSNLNTLQSILTDEDLKRLHQYIDGISSISYAYYPSKSIIGIDNMKTLRTVLKYMITNSFDAIHFDTISARLLPLLPFIGNKKIIATIHDPVPHIGEKTIKKGIINWLYSNVIDEYLFYSIYALNQFLAYRPSLHNKTAILKLLPYSYINNFKQDTTREENYILYFGRISAYKGVDLLINAADYISQQYPSIKICIAGKPHGSYTLDLSGKKNIQYINSYLSIDELAKLIQQSLFVVCPYKEATQSGVLMTALAMKKPVLATSVGAFSEYIKPGVNGILVESNVTGIQHGITRMLTDDYYLQLAQNIEHESNEIERQHNYKKYEQLYSYQV